MDIREKGLTVSDRIERFDHLRSLGVVVLDG